MRTRNQVARNPPPPLSLSLYVSCLHKVIRKKNSTSFSFYTYLTFAWLRYPMYCYSGLLRHQSNPYKSPFSTKNPPKPKTEKNKTYQNKTWFFFGTVFLTKVQSITCNLLSLEVWLKSAQWWIMSRTRTDTTMTDARQISIRPSAQVR